MRSGTTLLNQVICTSPDTNPLINGCRYLTGQLELYARYTGTDSLFIDDYFADQSGFREFTKSIILDFLTEAWRKNGQPGALVLKNPELSFYVPLLAGLLPDAMFVMSVREPKDTIASMIKVGRKQKKAGIDSFLARACGNITALCRTYNSYYNPVMKNMSTNVMNLGNRVLFVRYEDLVDTPDDTNTRVCRFCGIRPGKIPENGSWERSSNTEKIKHHSRWRTYLTDLSSSPVSASSIGSYESVLNDRDCARIDNQCKAIRKEFNYG